MIRTRIRVRMTLAAGWLVVAAAAGTSWWGVQRTAELTRRVRELSLNVQSVDEVEVMWVHITRVQVWIEPCAVVALVGAIALLATHALAVELRRRRLSPR